MPTKARTSKSQLLCLVSLLLLSQCVVCETIFLQKFPVNRVLSLQTELRLNRLKQSLQSFSSGSDKQELYLRVKLCEVYLQQLARQSMLDYDNMMQGSTNLIEGANNIVMGSKNTVKGKGNWIFTTNYNQSSDRVLVIDKWKIDMNRIEDIRISPNKTISQW